MVVSIFAKFTPFRLKLGRKEPVQMFVEVTNVGTKEEIITMDILLGTQLSFEKGGYRTSDSKKITSFKPGEKKSYYFDIWPKVSTMPREQPIKIKVSEHYRDFSHIINEYNKNLLLTVEP